MQAIYDATGGENWSEKSGWNTGQPLEKWHGVTVATESDIDCTGRVTELKLSDNNLSGNMPAELGDLACLYHLDLSNNELGGRIPASLGNLEALKGTYNEWSQRLTNCPDDNVIDLSHNDLTGAIPGELGNLRCLSRLDLSDNKTRQLFRNPLGDDGLLNHWC